MNVYQLEEWLRGVDETVYSVKSHTVRRYSNLCRRQAPLQRVATAWHFIRTGLIEIK
jgi:hypothetical protein